MSLPPWIAEIKGLLHAEGIPLTDIAARFGTPCYLYSASRIRENVEEFRAAFIDFPLELHYALKANPLGAILRLLAREGLGAEVVSEGELLRALRAGFPPRKIIFTGVGKTGRELRLALEAGIEAVVVECLGELGALAGIARDLGTTAPVALRLNPALSPETHPHLATGREGSKFGLDPEGMARALETISRAGGLRLVGLHVHLGSQIRTPGPYIEAWERLLEFHRRSLELGLSPEFLDLGGGFGIPYGDDGFFPLRELAETLARKIPPGMRLLLEPGRALVGDAGLLLTRVLHIKEVHGKRYVVVDAGMNDLLRPALYGARHRVVPVRRRRWVGGRVDVVGPICENTDVLAWDLALPELSPGDLLAVLDTGAYGSSMASNYNSRPGPAEILIYGGKVHLVKRRGSVEDLVRGEAIPEELR